MTRALTSPPAVVPASALAEWQRLAEALLRHGPAPCESGRALPAEAWWSVGSAAEPARMACSGCRVRQACLSYATAADERFGTWGGLTAEERRELTQDGAR